MENYIGEIRLFAFNYNPMYWMRCEGQVLSIQQNQALFALLGAKFGGDGRTTFALPDMRGISPHPSLCYCIAVQGEYPSRN